MLPAAAAQAASPRATQRKHKELNLIKIFSCRKKYCQMEQGTEDLIEMHDCYRQPDVAIS